jgi:hypothetical protein
MLRPHPEPGCVQTPNHKAYSQRLRWSDAVWWACQDLNLGPHPYQQNAGNRCANGRFRRSRATEEAEVMCSRGVQLCGLILACHPVDLPHTPSDLVRTYIALHHRCREGQLGKAGRSPPKFRAPWAALGSGLVVATNRPRRHCGSHDLQWVVPFSRPELEHSAERDRQADAGL